MKSRQCLGSSLHPEYVHAVGEQLREFEAVQVVFGNACCSGKVEDSGNLRFSFACDFLRFL